MIAEKIISVVAALGDLAGKVPADAWSVLSLARHELLDAAEQSRNHEKHMAVMPSGSGQPEGGAAHG